MRCQNDDTTPHPSKIRDFCHLPLKGKAWDCTSNQVLYKSGFVCDIITERKISAGIIKHKRGDTCLFSSLPIKYTQPVISGGKE
jgi:hypothetical protein